MLFHVLFHCFSILQILSTAQPQMLFEKNIKYNLFKIKMLMSTANSIFNSNPLQS